MMSNAKTVVMALLLAYRARAIPVAGASPEADIQVVIDALREQMLYLTPLGSAIVDDVETKLRANGILSPEHIAALEEKLHMLSPTPVINATHVAELAVGFLDEQGAFSDPAQSSIEDKTVVLTTEMINEVLATGSIGIKDCPVRHTWICCVVL